MRTLSYFTIKDLLHDHWRSLLTLLSLAVAIVGYLLLVSLSQAFSNLGKQPQTTHNLLIISADVLDPSESSLGEDILQTAQSISPGQILGTFPTFFRHMTVAGTNMEVRAVPLEEMPTALALTLLQGSWPAGTQQIVISEDAAQAGSWGIGSILAIYGSDFMVTGVVRASGASFETIWMNYTEGQRLFGTQRGFQIGYLIVDPAVDLASLRTVLQADPHFAGDYAVYLASALTNRYNQAAHNLLILSMLMALVSLQGVTIGIYNAIRLSITERSGEIDLLRVVGFARGKVRLFLLVRTLALTLAAYSLGWVVTVLFIQFQGANVPVIRISAAPVVLSLTPFASFFGLGLALVFAILGVWLGTAHFASAPPLAWSDR